ncbi:monofunctional biosynthetic peptidoglycan transglycosylase [Sandaracinobacteroides saxicola]|uniref:Biosynthetic peptidoglycan transglycosylase n=1 Tax=Sandaracinobacteroides saxicola TaxID=2759707 RepID=A0A7G5IGQ8_9SPHN|nr:monofunctional biosynthetic peptidoglycan transglycosylase [Sandaracinobacteroides saxicola]QMW22550.1 monofunctional biosynthetic peptidoglycan transglycosylase [Sandaracinobacteroides saxicola]
MIGRVLGWMLSLVFGLVLLSLLWVLAYRWVDPPITWIQARDRLAGVPVQQQWVGLEGMTRAMPRAVIGAEDANFCAHNGFDLEAIEAAMERNAKSKRVVGGSTISQQTAKNAFLWPQRSWVRKGLEAYFTVLIELVWGKPRIMEVYLNIAEMGRGIYGVEAASRHYFNKSAATLTRREAARLAAILPQPIKRDPTELKRKERRKARAIEKRIRVVRDENIDACLF